jgi:glycosyltransferase involved in cell wall biosynthesis
MPKINILYHHFPHYRRPVMRALQSSSKHTYRFFGGHNDVAGIKAFVGSEDIKVEPISFTVNPKTKKMEISNYDMAFEDCDALIVIGNPNIQATWRIAIRARMKGIKVLFWAHGWLRPEGKIKSLMRNFYFGLAHKVLVYGERAVTLAKESGFSPDRIQVIYNSLDFSEQAAVFKQYEDTPRADMRASLSIDTERPVLLCVSRLTEICYYDWLIEAAAKPLLSNLKPQLIFIGDGPSRAKLEALVKDLSVDAVFLGPIYDEQTLAQYIMSADAVVSPGKVGLTAMHALNYGTPVVTHGDLNAQMPEVEAVIPGLSGEYFEYGDVDSLSHAVKRVLDRQTSLTETRHDCREVILKKYTPEVQCRLIDEAIDAVL